MFEGIIKGLILSFFGDYIENLDKDKLSVAVKLNLNPGNNWQSYTKRHKTQSQDNQ
jgi:hypothetical protein